MATRPVKQNLPADLPENWTDSQYVSPGGTEVGLTSQHGYNYLNSQVNAVQRAAKEIDEAFENIAPLDPETKKIPEEYLLVDESLSATSTNPVQNKVVKTAIDEKANATNPRFTGSVKLESATASVLPMTLLTSSDGGQILYGAIDSYRGLLIAPDGLYAHQDGTNYKVYTENNKPPVDAELSWTSTNPVQNKVVNAAINVKANAENPMFSGDAVFNGGINTTFNPQYKVLLDDNTVKLQFSSSLAPVPDGVIFGNGDLSFSSNGQTYKVYTENNKPPVDAALSTTSENPVQNKAVKAALDLLQIQAGTYTGNGSESKTITLSRKPNWVLVLQGGCLTGYYYSTGGSFYHGGLALANSPVMAGSEKVVEITSTGFTVYNAGAASASTQVKANESKVTYHYIWG